MEQVWFEYWYVHVNYGPVFPPVMTTVSIIDFTILQYN